MFVQFGFFSTVIVRCCCVSASNSSGNECAEIRLNREKAV